MEELVAADIVVKRDAWPVLPIRILKALRLDWPLRPQRFHARRVNVSIGDLTRGQRMTSGMQYLSTRSTYIYNDPFVEWPWLGERRVAC